MAHIIEITDFSAPELDIYARLTERKHIEGKGAEVLARCPADIPVYTADLPVLTQLTGFHLTRGMLCAMRRPRLPSVAEVCANARRIAVLENIMNPTNIGAIFRSAAALNVDAVLLTAAGSDPLYRRAARATCSWCPGHICRRGRAGRSCCMSWASKPWPWLCGTTPWP